MTAFGAPIRKKEASPLNVNAACFCVLIGVFSGCRAEPPPAEPMTELAERADETTGVFPQRDPDIIRLGVVGYWGTPTHAEAFEPMARFLNREIERSVHIVTAEHYEDLVAQLEQGELELALLPPLVYVRAREHDPAPHLLRTMIVNGAVHYSGYIVVRADSPITGSDDLRGRSVAFVERSSASGYLFPKVWLQGEGLDTARDLDSAPFVGSHEEVLRAVIEKEIDAGATFQGAMTTARAIGLDTGILRVLAITGRIPLDALVAAPDLDSRLLRRIETALDALNTTSSEGREALAGLTDVSGWINTDDAFYDSVRVVVGQCDGGDCSEEAE